MVMKENKHNGIISFWKFAFAMMIVILHCSDFAQAGDTVIFKEGSIGVEFFFITSGFLLAVSAFKKIDDSNIIKDTWKFIYRKFIKLLPYVLFAAILLAAGYMFSSSHTLAEWITSIWDVLLLRMAGIQTFRLNAVAWYISAMLLAMLIIYPLVRKYKKKYTCFIAPLIIIFLAGFMSHEYGSLRTPMQWLDFCYKGTLRAFLEINIGVVAYEICQYLKTINFTKLGKKLLTFLEVACFTSIFLIVQFLDNSPRIDYVMLVILATGITIAFTAKTYTYSLCSNKFCYYLERLSLPVYLNQMFVINAVKYFSFFERFNYYQKIAIVLVLLIILSIITMKIIDLFERNKGKITSYFKNKLVEG